jgi:hypothetical protein
VPWAVLLDDRGEFVAHDCILPPWIAYGSRGSEPSHFVADRPLDRRWAGEREPLKLLCA